MTILLLTLLVLILTIIFFFNMPAFGKNPEGQKQERIIKSPNYKNSSFQNPEPTDVILKEVSYPRMMADFFFNKPKSTKPIAVPVATTDLKNLESAAPTVVWFGHSSYLLKTSSANILVDPVLKGSVSPVSFFGKPFPGADHYSVEDLPAIDIVVLTHDHYDHLHHQSILKLSSSVKFFCTSLGVGSHLERWGVDQNKIIEFDWWDQQTVMDGLKLTATPARHFSGRSFTRGKTLWSSFVLELDNHKIFLGGDSGYGAHFKTIGEKFVAFDLAILECGQYGNNWPHIHMMPEQTVLAGADLNAKVVLPVHWAKFELSMHPWNESINRFVAAAAKSGVSYSTPLIGEPVEIGKNYPNSVWWNS